MTELIKGQPLTANFQPISPKSPILRDLDFKPDLSKNIHEPGAFTQLTNDQIRRALSPIAARFRSNLGTANKLPDSTRHSSEKEVITGQRIVEVVGHDDLGGISTAYYIHR